MTISAARTTRDHFLEQADTRAAPAARWWYWVSRLICQFLFISLFHGRAFGRRNVPRTGGALLAANHQSFFDPILVGLPLERDCHYMARDTLFHHATFKRIIASYNAFPVRRGTADIGAIKECLRRLKAGHPVVAFPEGTRTPDGSILPMQPGMVVLARRAGVPIVPTLVAGAFEVWPRDRRLPRLGRLVVAYGTPLTPAQMEKLSDEECIRIVRARIVALLRRWGGPARAAPGTREQGYEAR